MLTPFVRQGIMTPICHGKTEYTISRQALMAFPWPLHSQGSPGSRNGIGPANRAIRSLHPRLHSIYFLAGLVLLSSMLVAGCNKEGAGASRPQQQRQTLHLGLVPEQSIFKQVHRYEPLADYLSRKLNVNVSLSVMPGKDKALSNFMAREQDVVFFGSMTYILAHARLGVEPIARPVNLDGTSISYSVMFVRKDSNIRSVREMKGKRLALVDRNTMAGYLLPLAYFKKAGIDYTTYLKEYYFSGTHEDVIYDVLASKADIGAAKSTVLIRF
jgi:phosphonate transport system substrate-binding protein